jgi:hypothetical protein
VVHISLDELKSLILDILNRLLVDFLAETVNLLSGESLTMLSLLEALVENLNDIR